MKIIVMMSGKKIEIPEEDFVKLEKVMEVKERGLIKIVGKWLNLSRIETVDEPDTEPYFMGNPMTPSMTKVQVGGEWKTFDQSYKGKIEMRQPISNKLLK